MKHEEVLTLSLDIGYRLLENGAEISRVEESIRRMVMAYGFERCDVFAIPSCIIVTAPDRSGEAPTQIRRLHTREINLGKVVLLNDLVRRVCRESPDMTVIRQWLLQIDQQPVFPFAVSIVAYALIAAAFTLFFGGNWMDALTALFCGALIRSAIYAMTRFQTNPFFIQLTASAIAATAAFIAVRSGLAIHMDKIIIGTLMNLVPGVAITTSIQDTIAGDLIAGLTKMAEALLTATAIALGSGIALALLQQI